MNVERIFAITLKVRYMQESVRFYMNILGLKAIYGGGQTYFSSLSTNDGKDTILNLEQGNPVNDWGRVIFFVQDVDKCLDLPEGERVQARKAKRRKMGRKVLPYAGPRWP